MLKAVKRIDERTLQEIVLDAALFCSLPLAIEHLLLSTEAPPLALFTVTIVTFTHGRKVIISHILEPVFSTE